MPGLGCSDGFPCVCSRWEEEKKEDGVKWMQLEHRGPYFVPLYEPLPEDVRFYYDGTAGMGPGAWGAVLCLGKINVPLEYGFCLSIVPLGYGFVFPLSHWDVALFSQYPLGMWLYFPNIPLENLWLKAGGPYIWLELWGFWGADPNGCFFSLSCVLDLSFVSSSMFSCELEKWDFTDPWPQWLTHRRIWLCCFKLLMSPGSPHVTLEQLRVSLAGQIQAFACSKAPFPSVHKSQKTVVQVGINHSLDICRGLLH